MTVRVFRRTFQGLYTPAGTPEAIVQRVAKEVPMWHDLIKQSKIEQQ